MTATRRSKVLGTAATAVAALGLSAALSAPAYAADTGSAKPAVSASSSQNLSHGTIHFEGQPFELKVAEQFRQIVTPGNPDLRLRDGATLVNGGFRLGGGSATQNAQSDVTENLRGTLTYTEPHSFTIQVTHFKLRVTAESTRAELAGDVRITGLAPQPIRKAGLDLLDLQLTEGKFSFNGNFEEFKDVPGLLSNQAAQIADGILQITGGILQPGTFIADTKFSIPVPR